MRLTPLAASLPATVPFVGPETQERAMGRRFVARLGANESVFGPSPAAVAAMAEAAAEAWQYGDPELYDLKAALAAHHGVAPANIVVGEGIDGLLGLLVRLLVAPGTPVVTSAGAYPTFAYHVTGFGGRLVTVPYRDDAEDPEALLLAARKAGAPLVYLANPDNPMGSWHAGARIAEMIARLPGDAVLCLDEAYADFAPPDAIPPIDPHEPPGDPDAHLLQGARHGRGPRRLRHRPPRPGRRLRPGPQPLRRRPHRPGRRARRPRRPRLARPRRRPTSPPPARDIARDRRGERPPPAALGHQLRDDRLRPRRRLRPRAC